MQFNALNPVPGLCQFKQLELHETSSKKKLRKAFASENLSTLDV